MPLPPPPPPERNGPDGSGPTGAGSPPPRPSGNLPTPPAAATGAATCYRHPQRAAGRRCTRCGRPACEACLVQASVGSNCVECVAKAQPDLKTRARYWQAGKPALVTYVLLALNVGAFVLLGLYYDLAGMLSGQLTEAHVQFGLSPFFLDGDVKATVDPVTLEPFITEGNEWYRLITSGFLHYGLIHIGFNMLFLYQLGMGMEPQLGRRNFALLYFASLLGGSAGALIVDQGGITAGASGAVFGLMGAYAIGMWRNGINPFTTSIGSLLLINLFLTFAISNISIGGHLGGAVAGALCGAVLFAPRYRPVPPWAMWATPVAVGVASVAIAVVAAGA